MFTGIVQGTGTIRLFELSQDFARVYIDLSSELLANIKTGASVSTHGVCLTVVEIDDKGIGVDVMKETLLKTNFGTLHVGDKVNIERSMRMGDEIGGHVMSGHIAGTAEVVRRQEDGDNVELRLRLPEALDDYVFEKGFIGLNGCSLTVTDLVQKNGGTEFSVWLIPETLKLTTFAEVTEGSRVNVEIDPKTQVIVDTVKRELREQFHKSLAKDFVNLTIESSQSN